MKRVLALVEGQTEEAFIGKCLAPHLWPFDIHIDAKIVVTRRVRSGPNNKGGVSSWNQIARDLRLLLGDSNAVAVTTLLDYYGLPGDVPGMATRPPGTPHHKAQHVQTSIDAAIGDARMRSNLLVHEFEALLYSDPSKCGDYLSNARLATAMHTAIASCGAPELVNDNPVSAPSKRILSAYPGYSKTLDGPSLAEEIGLAVIRSVCPHFDDWLCWVEAL
ncbi:MAG: DUF4276 family protein [Acidimicrobiales bacterium]